MAVRSKTPAEQGRPNTPATDHAKGVDPDWAWDRYRPDSQQPWNLAWAGHLYRRAAFGATWAQLQQAVADGPQRTIDALLRPDADVEGFNRTYDDYEASATDSGSAATLRGWWLRRMIHTPHPLLEKMTLFWHNHFATSNVTVKSALLMQRHACLLRSHALGCYAQLMDAISRDPAMLMGLDAVANRKALPNPNYALQLMDTFGLGSGHYCQRDIEEAARAFTGWFVLRSQLRYIPREHDAGLKTVLGRKGNFGGKDVVQIVLSQPAAPRLLVQKLYRWLISETDQPDQTLVAPLAESFGKDYDVMKLVGTMLRSNLFFSPAAYRRRVKSPVEFALGIVRGMEASVSTARLGEDLAALGQDLYRPPTVKGWPGGRHWINQATLLGRCNFARSLLAGSGPYDGKLDPLAIARKHGYSTPEAAAQFLFDLFVQNDVGTAVRETLLADTRGPGDPSPSLRTLAHGIVTLPEFQLA